MLKYGLRGRRLLCILVFLVLTCGTVSLFMLTALTREEGIRRERGVSQQEPAGVMNGHRDIKMIKPTARKEESVPPGHATIHKRLVTSLAASATLNSSQGCDGPWPDYPLCDTKMKWMADHWKVDPCYAESGVDGSNCSFQRYLSEVERWCPALSVSKIAKKAITRATVQYNVEPLLAHMLTNKKFDWLARRISTNWKHWSAALHRLEAQAPFNHGRKTILVHIGALSDKSGFKFAENADHGGPLGELVQWSDLIASLHLLGHSVDFSTEIKQLEKFLVVKKGIGGCPTKSETRYDVIYIDIVGLKQFKKLVGSRLQHYQCLFRVLDSFGTEPQFNYKPWKPPSFKRKGDTGQMWGNFNFYPRQFLNMYPHTPDNSFLGFVVGNINATPPAKKNMGLVYGKELYMWQGKKNYLDLISRYLDIHATVGTVQQKKNILDPSVIPGYVTNHGILDSKTLQQHLRESKVFIGLGFPYEGPAPLEAIANGCFFLNPKLSPPLHRYNSAFLKGKPTLRSLTSQNPYAERFIGEPYVFTIDMNNKKEVIDTLEKIKHLKTPPGYLPYEFTYEGMLERVAVYLENQDFCSPHQWPGRDTLITKISNKGESCKDACYREGLVCEPELFFFLNTKSALSEHFTCSSEVVIEHSFHGPSFNTMTSHCSLQLTKLLYSCVGSESSTRRLCPCRTYRKGQVALCSTCTH